jgi:hypothetical protein
MHARPESSCSILAACGALVVALLVLLGGSPVGAPALRAQAAPDIAVVVNPAVPIEGLSLADLRRIWLGDRDFWPAGTRITLLIRAPIARERDAVVHTICQMTEAQFRQHWIAKVFRADTATGPKLVYSKEAALEQVSHTQGGLTFVETPVVSRSVKVLRIDGKLPGQAGYALR